MANEPIAIDKAHDERIRQASLAKLGAAMAEVRHREARLMTEQERDALARLIQIALRDTGQSKRVADFLLAWYNAAENGGWDPADLWAVDLPVGDDMMTVLGLVHGGPRGKYPNDWGFRKEIERVWELWRSDGRSSKDLPGEHEH